MVSKSAILTLGYERITPQDLLEAVRRYGVGAVIDIRTLATSRTPGFEGGALEGELAELGIGYFHEPELGDLEDPDGSLPLEAVERVRRIASRATVLVLCKEESPVQCRRALLAARLAQEGHEVRHLGSGSGSIRPLAGQTGSGA